MHCHNENVQQWLFFLRETYKFLNESLNDIWDEYIYIYIYITLTLYIYIYIYTNLISTSIHGTKKKTLPGTRDKSISNHRPGKKKKIIGQKERKGQPHPTPWKKSRDTQSGVKRKLKTFHESCNATITKVLNTSGVNYKINLNRESKTFY